MNIPWWKSNMFRSTNALDIFFIIFPFSFIFLINPLFLCTRMQFHYKSYTKSWSCQRLQIAGLKLKGYDNTGSIIYEDLSHILVLIYDIRLQWFFSCLSIYWAYSPNAEWKDSIGQLVPPLEYATFTVLCVLLSSIFVQLKL